MWECGQTASIPLLSESSHAMQIRFWRSLIHVSVPFLTLSTLVRICNDGWAVSPMPVVGIYTHIYPLGPSKASFALSHTKPLHIYSHLDQYHFQCPQWDWMLQSQSVLVAWIVNYLCCVFMPGCHQWTWTWHFRLAAFTCLCVFKIYTPLSTACKLNDFNRKKYFIVLCNMICLFFYGRSLVCP